MSLPVDFESDGYRFYKTLHNDLQLKSANGSKYDLQFENGDIVNVTGEESLVNAVIIAIMTRFNELARIWLYDGFGCKVHENIKKNKSVLTARTIEFQALDVLKKMRRVRKVNYLNVTDTVNGYNIDFSVTALNDTVAVGSLIL